MSNESVDGLQSNDIQVDCNQIKKWTKSIKVTNQINEDVEVKNKSPLQMIGRGRQGAVFAINDDVCVKVYGEIDDCEREHYAMSLGKDTDLLPTIYCKGKNFIAMEIVKGIDMREYLQSQPLTKELSYKLIQLLLTFKEIGYERIDHHKRQIFIQPDGSLKVIDVGRTVWRDRTYPYPRKLLTSLGDDYKSLFIEHVKEMAPELYNEWEHYMHMEQLARDLHEKITTDEPIDLENISEETAPLLTTENKKEYYSKLEQLVRKVHKEEWIKSLISEGHTPEEIKHEIDKHLKQDIEVFERYLGTAQKKKKKDKSKGLQYKDFSHNPYSKRTKKKVSIGGDSREERLSQRSKDSRAFGRRSFRR